ncbi:uncharacterized protein VTP21DRAFT_5143 [Calcarisporiella thermophila]|uniref:uncharacterized protein n=1 Tax=Calcarisporiella thermophila TaxID=911321 RepID=UPI003742A754
MNPSQHYHAIHYMIAVVLLLFSCSTVLAISRLQPRQDPNSACQNVTGIYCYPTSETVWTLNTTQAFIWNTRNELLAPVPSVSIYLFYLENNINVPTGVSWECVGNSGFLEVHVNDSWFPKPDEPISRNWTFAFQIMDCASSSEKKDPRYTIGPTFLITRPGLPPTTTVYTMTIPSSATVHAHSTATSTSPLSPHPNSFTNVAAGDGPGGSDGLPPWAIGVISAAGFCLLCSLLIGLYHWKMKRRPRPQHPNPSVMPMIVSPPSGDGKEKQDSIYDNSISGGTDRASSNGTGMGRALLPATGDEGVGRHQNSPLPSFDALAFSSGAHNSAKSPEEIEEERRRRGQELLLRELENEGTLLHGVSRKRTVLNRVEEEEGMAGQLDMEES